MAFNGSGGSKSILTTEIFSICYSGGFGKISSEFEKINRKRIKIKIIIFISYFIYSQFNQNK